MKKASEKVKPQGGQLFVQIDGEPRMILDTVTGYRDDEAVNALVARWISEGMNDVVTTPRCGNAEKSTLETPADMPTWDD